MPNFAPCLEYALPLTWYRLGRGIRDEVNETSDRRSCIEQVSPCYRHQTGEVFYRVRATARMSCRCHKGRHVVT